MSPLGIFARSFAQRARFMPHGTISSLFIGSS
jgi:hypothetical protein